MVSPRPGEKVLKRRTINQDISQERGFELLRLAPDGRSSESAPCRRGQIGRPKAPVWRGARRDFRRGNRNGSPGGPGDKGVLAAPSAHYAFLEGGEKNAS